MTQDPPTLQVIGNAQGLVKGFKSSLLTETKSDPSTKARESYLNTARHILAGKSSIPDLDVGLRVRVIQSHGKVIDNPHGVDI